jgi:nicotinamidase-related amidase
MKTALLVIDAQKSFKARPFWSEQDIPAWQLAQQQLIDACVARSIPVVQVFHQTADNGPFDPRQGLVSTLDEIGIDPALVIHKHKHSALAGTPLLDWLIGQNIQRLLISGIRTEQCCETTARHASDLGFSVDFFSDATLTFAMTHPHSGITFTADEIKARTELVLAGRFVRLRTVSDFLASDE